MQLADDVRNAMNDAFETAIGTSAILRIRSGAAPANVAAAASGTVIAEMNLPSDWMANSASGIKGLTGTWQDTGANAAHAGGTAHFEICTSGGVRKAQGTVGVGSGELQLDNLNIAAGQPVTVTAFNITMGGA